MDKELTVTIEYCNSWGYFGMVYLVKGAIA